MPGSTVYQFISGIKVDNAKLNNIKKNCFHAEATPYWVEGALIYLKHNTFSSRYYKQNQLFMNAAGFWKELLVVLGLCLMFSQTSYSRENRLKTGNSDSTVNLDFSSEPHFNLSIHSGYALALGSNFQFYPDDISSIIVDILERSVPTKSVTYSSPTKGLGEGFRAGAGISYILNDFMNVGIDIDYFKSTITKSRDSSFHQTQTFNSTISDYKYNSYSDISYSATMISFSPSITFKALTAKKFLLYNRLGAVIIFRPKSIEKEAQYVVTKTSTGLISRDLSGTAGKEYEWKIRNPAFGVSASVGIQVKLTEKIRGFAELQFSHVVFEAKSRTLKEFNVNGKDVLNTLPVNMKEIVFLKNYTATNGVPDPNIPTETLSQSIPITYGGLQIGLTYRF